MAQDIKKLLKQEVSLKKMPKNHEARFVEKLDTHFPKKKTINFSWLSIAASVVLLISFVGYNSLNTEDPITVIETPAVTDSKSLSDVSPTLKKVEEYYLASINLELSKLKYTAETKELFDGYLERLNDLNTEYERLGIELTKSGPNEATINALIDNLKLRLNLLYRLKDQLKNLNTSETNQSEVKSIS